ncbi:MAG: hypothetical protein RBS39_07335 [Phycisphaerales bacterium]|jgi:hypothetical protein|nr:hypothetical protein [Phycisphaerales bacterium]
MSRRAKMVVQLVGFALALAMFAWCVWFAWSSLGDLDEEELRAKGMRALDITWGGMGQLAGLSVGSIVVNGLIFWVTLRPVRRVGMMSVQATNGIASLLGLLPLKIGFVARVALHHRRDGVPVVLVAAWVLAVLAVFAGSIGVIVAVALVRPAMDGTAWTLLAAGMVAMAVCCVGSARLLGSSLARTAAGRAAERLPGWVMRAVVRPVARGGRGAHARAMLTMLASPRCVGTSSALRVVDFTLLSMRYMVAAEMAGQDLGFGGAVLLAAMFYAAEVASPVGVLGVREAGTIALGTGAGAMSMEALAVVTLLVSGGDTIGKLVCGLLGALWHRPDRVLRAMLGEARSGARGEPDDEADGEASGAAGELALGDADRAVPCEPDRR